MAKTKCRRIDYGAPDIEEGDQIFVTHEGRGGLVIFRERSHCITEIHLRWNGIPHYLQWIEFNARHLPSAFVEQARQVRKHMETQV